MGLRNPVALAGVVGVGIPVLAAGVVAALTIKPGDSGPDSTGTTSQAAPLPPAAPAPPTPPSAPATPPATADPVGFQPDSVNFVSADEGWVLGRTYPCAKVCQSLQHTTDGGQTWQQVALPAPLRTTTEAGMLRFADSSNGWIRADGKLFATHDAGKTWHQVDLDMNAVMDSWTMSVADDTVYIAATQRGERVVLFSSPVDSDSWTETTDIPAGVGGGPDPTAEVTAVGSRAWMIVTNGTRSGARLVNGTWSPWQLPCGGNGPADWHAFSEKRIVVLCGRPGPGTNDSSTTHLMTSTDGGSTFTETATLSSSLSTYARLLAADPLHLVAVLDERVFTSTDGGENWTVSYTTPDGRGEPRAGQFVSETTGFVVMVDTGPRHDTAVLLVTHDTGRTWTPVTPGS